VAESDVDDEFAEAAAIIIAGIVAHKLTRNNFINEHFNQSINQNKFKVA